MYSYYLTCRYNVVVILNEDDDVDEDDVNAYLRLEDHDLYLCLI